MSAESVGRRPVELSELIDSQPLGGLRTRLYILLFLAMAADGYDIISISYAIAPIGKSWGVAGSEFGLVFAFGTAGMALGSWIGGLLADQIGRRYTVILNAAFTGVMSLGTIYAYDIASLAAWRLMTGIGVGGLTTSVLVLSMEFAPERIKTQLGGLIQFGAAFGGLCLCGLVTVYLVPSRGWQVLFLVGGIVPLTMAALMWWKLPESPKYLYVKRPGSSELRQICEKLMATPLSGETQIAWSVEARSPGKTRLKLLFNDGRGPVTLLLWTSFFCIQVLAYSLSLWLPSMLGTEGLDAGEIVTAMLLFALAGAVGGLVACRAADAIGMNIIVAILILGIPLVFVIGTFNLGNTPLILTVSATGFVVTGSSYALYASSGALYPTSARANGIGTAFLVGRLGAILGPFLVGILLSGQGSLQMLFLACSVPLACAAAAIWLMVRRARRIGILD